MSVWGANLRTLPPFSIGMLSNPFSPGSMSIVLVNAAKATSAPAWAVIATKASFAHAPTCIAILFLLFVFLFLFQFFHFKHPGRFRRAFGYNRFSCWNVYKSSVSGIPETNFTINKVFHLKLSSHLLIPLLSFLFILPCNSLKARFVGSSIQGCFLTFKALITRGYL